MDFRRCQIQYQSAHHNSDTNWVDLTELLKDKIPAVIWHFDLPNDGSNILKNKPVSEWRSSLILINEISDAGHYPWFENPKELVMAIENFYSVFEL